jgi:hypothetical protein
MKKHTVERGERRWHDSAHASLCVLGGYLRRIGFFRPLEAGVRLKQKVLRYTPVQKLEMLFVALLAGAKAVSHTGLTLRVDRALQAAFGLPGCADQSVIADTLDAASEADVADLRAAVETLFIQHRQARRHDFAQAVLVLDLDLSPLPASKACEGSTKGYMGRCRSKTGRKLVRVRAAAYGAPMARPCGRTCAKGAAWRRLRCSKPRPRRASGCWAWPVRTRRRWPSGRRRSGGWIAAGAVRP